MKFIISLSLLLAIQFTYAQNNLSGKVKDKNTQEPIVFANVYLPQIEKGTTTDDEGLFMIKNIPAGTYKVIVSFIGYETQSLNISFPTAKLLEVLLNPSAIEMEEIIVSTPFHKLQSENVMKVEQKNISDLKANGAVTLADGISDIAGVSTVTTGLSIGKPVIRGLSSNRVLVYTQGVRLENQQFGDEHGLGMNDAGVESVEVIKGPASLLYGSDAIGGVLYLNPEKFATENNSKADVSLNYYTNTIGYSTNAGYKASGEKFKFIFRGSLSEHSDYKTKDYRVTNTRFNERDFKAGFGYQAKKIKTELRYNVNNSKLGIPEELGEQSTSKSPLAPYQNITSHIFSSKSTLFLNKSSVDINLGYLYNDRKEYEEYLAPSMRLKLKTANYDVKYNLPQLGAVETIVGLQGMTQNNKNYGEEELIPNATTNDIGLLATSHVHFEKLDVQLGARFDNRYIDVENGITKKYNSFNGALGFKMDLLKHITTRLNFATGFRAPNLAELTSDGIHEGTNRYEIGNADLNNEQNFQTDLSLEFKNQHLELFANGFYNVVNDYIFISPNGEELLNNPIFVYNQEDAQLYGGEFGIHLHPHPIDWLHFETSFETVTGKRSNDQYLPLIPANSLSNTLRIEFNKRWIDKGYAFIKLISNFAQNNVSTFETSTEGYKLLSAGFGGKVKLFENELSISISGTNLTDKAYINHLSRLKQDNIYNIGRNFNIGLTYLL